jgi:hypothetical protein
LKRLFQIQNQEKNKMASFMLLLHDATEGFGDLSADEVQKVIGEYIGWRNKIAGEGKLIGGEKLADEGGKHLSMSGGEIRVTDGPYAEVKEALGGYFAIKAADYDEAVEIAKGCPHIIYGKKIEVRKIEETH